MKSKITELIEYSNKKSTEILNNLNINGIIPNYHEYIVFHYTSISNFIKICETKSLHFTKIDFMNDTSEVSYGCNFMNDFVKTHFPNLKQYSRYKYDPRFGNSFVLSASEKVDELGLWRMYGDNARGCSIGINIESLNNIVSECEHDFSLEVKKVIYDRDQQIEIANQLCERFVSCSLDKDQDTYAGQIAFNTMIKSISPFFKNDAYAHENEVRLLLNVPYSVPPFKFKATNNEIIPFVELIENNFNDKAIPGFINSVGLGPVSNKESLSSSLQLMCYKSDIDHNSFISKSKAPYKS